jgi:diacylglycerol kinase (ATP)
MRIVLVHNPSAGSAVPVRDLVKLLKDAGHRVKDASVKDGWMKLLKKSTDLVVAAGGDGTVRDVALAVEGTDTPFSILPFGTANNVGKTLGLLGYIRPLTEAWESAAPQAFDIAEVNGPGGSDRFVESFGGGLFAELGVRGRAVEGSAVVLGRQTDRALHLLSELLQEAEARPWRLSVDGEELNGSFLAVEVLNIRFAGPNVPLAPEADPGDGRLQVALIREEDRDGLRDYVDGRMRLASGLMPPVTVLPGTRISLTVPAGVRLHLDDKPWPSRDAMADAPDGPMELHISIHPAAAKILA